MAPLLQKIDNEFLKNIHTGNYHTPTMYFHPNPAVRWLFWERLNQITNLLTRSNISTKRCLDFGGGSGIFLPTLCSLFDEVILVDIDPSQARIIQEKFNLGNCTILEKNIYKCEFDHIDCIIAADVIEHFEDTTMILNKLKSLMNNQTILISSLPTENWLYDFLRFLFRQEKPFDHYHPSKSIQKVFKELGFNNMAKSRIPLPGPFNLFDIDCWQKHV